MTNIYKPIPTFNMYAINAIGQVRQVDDGCIVEPFILSGYYHLTLLDNDGSKRIMGVHRLVAMVWLDLPDNWENLVVNHLNGNKLDNRNVNLEWCTHQENMYHAGLLGLTDKCIPIQVRNVITGTVLVFPSFLAAAKHYGLSKDAISWRVNSGESYVDDLFNQYRPLNEEDPWKDPDQWKCGILLKNAVTGEVKLYPSQNEICLEYGVSPAYLSLRMTDPSQPLFRLNDGLYQIGINRANPTWVDHGDPYLAFEKATQVKFIVMYNPSIENKRIFFSLNEAATAYGFKKNVPYYRAKVNQLEPWHDGIICHYLFNN